MASIQITHLLNSINLHSDPHEEDKVNSQQVVDYCEARFRVILPVLFGCTDEQQKWMSHVLFRELVFLSKLSLQVANGLTMP